jgi:hypothetical protein
MLKAAFITLRVLTGIASLATFAGTVVLIILTGTLRLFKGGAHAAISVAKLFISGFQKSDPAQPVPHLFSLPLIGLAILFLSMFTSVFTPGQKIFLHIVAAMTAIAAIWRIWMIATQPDTAVLFLPVLWLVYYTAAVLWFIYYIVALRYR